MNRAFGGWQKKMVGAEGIEPPRAYATPFQRETAARLRNYAPI
jgi:hypothetical protein